MTRIFPKQAGWLPWGWLVYLLTVVVHPILTRAGALEWTLTALGVGVFLPLYVAGFWTQGVRLVGVIVGMVLLGLAFAPFNPAGGVFFVYAAACAGELERPRWARTAILTTTAIAAVDAWILEVPPYVWSWWIVISLLVGFANLHSAEQRRSNARLRRAHDEIERLAKVAERERIARDLHDLLGHTLSVVVLKSELARKLFDREPERARREIAEVESIAREALSEVRLAVQGYRSEGLAAEIERTSGALAAAGVACELQVEPIELDARREAVLAFAVREAVTNVVRHARASRCRITLQRADGSCRLVVADDGRGGGAPFGAGLAGMQARVEAEGGTMVRDSEPGTTLTVTLPCPTGSAALESA